MGRAIAPAAQGASPGWAFGISHNILQSLRDLIGKILASYASQHRSDLLVVGPTGSHVPLRAGEEAVAEEINEHVIGVRAELLLIGAPLRVPRWTLTSRASARPLAGFVPRVGCP